MAKNNSPYSAAFTSYSFLKTEFNEDMKTFLKWSVTN